MKFSIDKKEKFTVFTPGEENLNAIKSPVLKSELVLLKNEGVPNLILDLEKVSFIDSSGLSAILTGNRLWKDDSSFIVTNINSDNVRKLITISRLDTILTIVPTLSESIDYVMMEELERELIREEPAE